MNSVAEDTGTGGGQGCGGIPVHPEFQWVHSVLDQTGLEGSPNWQMNQANIDDPHVQEELFSSGPLLRPNGNLDSQKSG